MEKQLKIIIDKADKASIVPFLQKLTPEEKQTLYPVIKKMEAAYFRKEFYSDNSNQNADRYEIYRKCLFFFLKKSDLAPNMYWKLPSSEIIQQMLEWYRPDWFSDYVNTCLQNENCYMPYSYIAEWTDRKLIDPSPEIIVQTLPDYSQADKYSFVLDEHVWYIFQYPSPIHWADRDRNFWINTLCNAANSGRIDRIRLLQESLLMSVRNLDKIQTGWGINLFLALKPTTEELITIQQELLTALTSPHSKAVNTVLTLLKKLSPEKEFDREAFIFTTSALLSSEVKSIITSTLSILEKLGKKYSENRKSIVQTVVNAFMCKDETIQTKAAKLFLEYACKEEPAQNGALLEPYISFMFVSAKTLLKDYITTNQLPADTIPHEEAATEPELLSKENRIPVVATPEELPFFIGDVFANLRPWQYYALADAFIRLTAQLDGNTCNQLEPAYQKAYKTLNRGGSSFFEYLLIVFFMSYVDYLIELYPDRTSGLQKLRDKFKHITSRLETWQSAGLYLLEPFRQILTLAMNRIKAGRAVTLLSTPTHYPCWIHPVALVDRVRDHLQNGVEPDNVDLQLAIQRCAMGDTSEALLRASELPESEYKYLLLFLFSGELKYKEKAHNLHWWLTAALSLKDKSLYREFLDESSSLIPPAYFSGSFDWVIGNRNMLNLYIPGHGLSNSNRKLLIEYLFSKKKRYFMTGDLCHLMHSFPNCSDYVLRHIFYDEASYNYEPKHPIEVLTALLELKQPLGEFSYLTLSSFMLIAHKEIRLLTSEIWLAYINAGLFDATKAGTIIGRLINGNWSSPKRFTDQLIAMINISPTINKALGQVVDAVIAQIDTPTVNMKKLREIHRELVAE
ncbi:DUF6493 family protein [Bacteroides sp. 224]|uniref:DUF6493 family protein n=1 Tax=Bacteroides sp. 224 TaxID=2302936 RepID=UPI0013D6912F|nr:DUF6493 family protein [Bacteroides sp. 224]NDV66659.1 hypothetical protein [Bacteroides sp. 224]